MSKHLWVALSPHGYGHGAMTAPVVQELRRRRPGLRVTIQTALPAGFLADRFGDGFEHVPDIPDFGLHMTSSVGIEFEASAAAYRALHADWPGAVEREAGRLAAARPDLVLANIPYVTIAAAARVGVPVVALSSLNWAGIYAHYFGDRPEAGRIAGQMRAAYAQAAVFLRCLPAMDMDLPNLLDIGTVARRGADRRRELRTALGVGDETRVGVVAFGGIDHRLRMELWPRIPGWRWLVPSAAPGREDLVPWEASGLSFTDLLSSVDVAVSKPGYGTFTEAGLSGTPMLYLSRPDWPECPHLDRWLERHAPCRAVAAEDLLSPGLAGILDELLSCPRPAVAQAAGIAEATDILEGFLDGGRANCLGS
ncbi:MAG: hypothetical protein M0006_02195 [Magnetospirillum sp.]|nr:hypothetical protein [Magnetospirillum sp.]